jgi:hypothetical protein
MSSIFFFVSFWRLASSPNAAGMDAGTTASSVTSGRFQSYHSAESAVPKEPLAVLKY